MEDKAKIQEYINHMADIAEKHGADSNDEDGIVRSLVTQLNLGFEAWFCVCCELADREARKEGFKDKVDRAYSLAKERIATVTGPA